MGKINYSFAEEWPSMYNKMAREEKAGRIVKILQDYYGKTLKDLTLLDVGSSTGIMDNILANSFKTVIGTDVDTEAIKFAKNHFHRKNLFFFVKDAMKLDLSDNSFDVVVCAQVYEHVPNANKLFSEIHRVLKPGGVCYLAALNKYWPLEPHYKLLFLSWLPKSIANIYIMKFKHLPIYPENLLSFWELKKITHQFTMKDYTEKILKDPIKFGYGGIITSNSFVGIFSWLLSPLVKFFTPTFFWILVKEKR